MTASSSALTARTANVLESEVNSPPSSLLIRIVRVLLGVVRAVCAVRLAAGGAHAVAIVTDPVEAPQADLRAERHATSQGMQGKKWEGRGVGLTW